MVELSPDGIRSPGRLQTADHSRKRAPLVPAALREQASSCFVLSEETSPDATVFGGEVAVQVERADRILGPASNQGAVAAMGW